MSTIADTRSVLVIGATGRSGQAVLRALQETSSHPSAHAFVRTPAKLPSQIAERCKSVITGDASDSDAVKRALEQTGATDVVMCVGHPDPRAVTDVRAVTGRALADAVTHRLKSHGTPTRVVIESSIGAGDSTIRLGFGMGKLMSLYLGRALTDHNQQERVVNQAFEERPGDLLIVRPTGLKDGEATGRVRVHGNNDSVKPSVNRADVAAWIVEQICGKGDSFGKAVVISSS